MIYINDIPVNTTLFPDNTSQVWKLGELPQFVVVRWVYSHEGEFMQLAQLKALLDMEHIAATLELPYLPYGRQDKLICNESCFALHVFADLLNHLKFSRVTVTDPHSHWVDVIDRVVEVYPVDAVRDIAKSYDLVCYPDKGAARKYVTMYDLPFIQADKVRDQATGEIAGLQLYGDCNGQAVLIVDDICDGGATFVRLAELLYRQGAGAVGLFVTHGIFSKGLRPLTDAGITAIYDVNGRVTTTRFQ